MPNPTVPTWARTGATTTNKPVSDGKGGGKGATQGSGTVGGGGAPGPGGGKTGDKVQDGSAKLPPGAGGGAGGGAQPAKPWWELGGGGWGSSGGPMWGAPEEGVLGNAARNIVRGNPVLDSAANQLFNINNSGSFDLASDQIFSGNEHPQYGRASAILDNIGKTNWYDEAASRDLYDTRELAAKSVNPNDIRGDAAVKESIRQFQQAELPLIENMAAVSGLGRSTAVNNAAAARQAATMLPLLQEATGRAERRQNRILDAAFGRAQGHSQKGTDIANRRLQGAAQSTALGGQMASSALGKADRLIGMAGEDRARQERLFDKLFQFGDYGRGLEQEANDAQRDDWLRLAGMFENSVNGPAGLIPNVFGASTSGGKK